MYRADLDWAAYGFGEALLGMSDVKLDHSGNLWTLDRGGRPWADRSVEQRIGTDVLRCWSPDGQLQQALGARLFVMPHSVTPCEDGLLVTDVGLHQVLKLTWQGTVDWSLGDAGSPTDSLDGFNLPTDVAVCEDGAFYVSDGYGNSRVLKFNRDRGLDCTWGRKGTGVGEFNLPHSLDILDDSTVVVADRENSRVQLFDLSGEHLGTLESDTIGKPFGVSVRDRRIYVVDNGFPQQKRAGVSIHDLDRRSTDRFGRFGKAPGEMLGPHSIAVDCNNDVFVADVARGLLKFTPT